ncbi:unnamed protein product [Parnassius mnemosyne]|uniref:Uncharacterized protein n=1 Tax=Parnassius mnemosyne TaxID=213953 RepID=A0AAV1KKW0_9NEOP
MLPYIDTATFLLGDGCQSLAYNYHFDLKISDERIIIKIVKAKLQPYRTTNGSARPWEGHALTEYQCKIRARSSFNAAVFRMLDRLPPLQKLNL